MNPGTINIPNGAGGTKLDFLHLASLLTLITDDHVITYCVPRNNIPEVTLYYVRKDFCTPSSLGTEGSESSLGNKFTFPRTD